MKRSRFERLETERKKPVSEGFFTRVLGYKRRLELPNEEREQPEKIELDPERVVAIEKKESRDALEYRIRSMKRMEKTREEEALRRQAEKDRERELRTSATRARQLSAGGRIALALIQLWIGVLGLLGLWRMAHGVNPDGRRVIVDWESFKNNALLIIAMGGMMWLFRRLESRLDARFPESNHPDALSIGMFLMATLRWTFGVLIVFGMLSSFRLAQLSLASFNIAIFVALWARFAWNLFRSIHS